MTSVADSAQLQDSVAPSPAAERAQRAREAKFYLGLISLMIVVVFGSLAAISVLPYVVPGYSSASIVSGSMEPKLRPGDVVIAEFSREGTIDVGTVIVFIDPRRGDLVTHRIVEHLDDRTYRTRGDANGVVDAHPVPPENVLGVGRWVVPWVGQPRVWMANEETGLLVATGVIAALLLWLSRFAVEDKFDPWPEADEGRDRRRTRSRQEVGA